MGRVRGMLTRPVVVGVLVVAVALVGVGLYWFQPWKLWQDETVEEALPEVTTAPTATVPPETPQAEASGPAESAEPTEPAGPVVVASGELISHEHATSGTVRLLRLTDGSHVVRLEDLDTSNGPDLRVWLTDAPVKEGVDGWRVFDDGKYESLGKLKGNKGSQNYPLPAGVDPADFSSVSIWCDRFDVSFGAAELARA
ncbi:DM13 domain-containing protein [Streptomyces sp. B93]|uniref:DM13 domain-containing protein n=1 Tax=Streptomyces sp. B93 TaxID=2824875 RepID=UPI001B389275|nr:DM13 domain-containing protein [Streptomyces sp. B93]MBQ1089999.1 DM13 domain-containing protein [Streptomyces sp. B93]